jgi:methanogenic corrinoid protein MtbC1
MQRFFSPKTLAQAIGVSESSLKRWADEGLLEVARTAGGHRRIEFREAIRYIRKAGHPVVRPELLGIPDLPSATSAHASPPTPSADSATADAALIAAVTAGDAETARALTVSQYLAGREVADLCDGPLTAALQQVGGLWQHGPEGIYVEHRATDLCTQCLHQLRTLFPPPLEGAPTALGGAVEGDPYALPTLMVAAVIGAAGWRAINLGPNLPPAALLAAAKEHHPALVWLSCSSEEAALLRAAELRKSLQHLARRGVHLVAGGRAWPARGIEPAGGMTVAKSMGELAAFLRGLHAVGRVP